MQCQYFGNVVAAGQVVHRHGQHAGAEAGADAAFADTFLYHFEEGAQKAVSGGDFLIERVVVGSQQLVGEVVIFVNQDIDFWQVVFAGIAQGFFQHLCCITTSSELKISEDIAIMSNHDFRRTAVQNIEVLLQLFHVVRHHHCREVVANHHILIMLRCGVAAYIRRVPRTFPPRYGHNSAPG